MVYSQYIHLLATSFQTFSYVQGCNLWGGSWGSRNNKYFGLQPKITKDVHESTKQQTIFILEHKYKHNKSIPKHLSCKKKVWPL